MNKEKLNLWNRDFELFINYSCYPGEEITDIQTTAAGEFCADTSVALAALDELKAYIEKSSVGLKADEIENIFKYVMPKSIFIPRTENKIVAIICNYKFDMEHGIAVVFENGMLKEIGPQDIIL